MSRKWGSFDTEVTNRELEAIPYPDRGALYQAMAAYAEDLDIRYSVKNYGDDLMMLKASNGTSGRCLFFSRERIGDSEKLVALLFYKKESEEAPKRVIEAARARMIEYRKKEKPA